MRNLVHTRLKTDNQDLPWAEESSATMEREGKKLWPRAEDCRFCNCVGCLKAILVFMAILILLNTLTGFNFSNPVVIHVMKRISSYLYPADVQNLFQREERLRSLYETQCQGRVNDFSDGYNRTLRSYANMDTEEPRLKYALSEMLDENFSLTFDRMLHKPRYAFLRARFMLRLKTLGKIIRMSYDPRVMRRLVPDVKVHIDMHYRSINAAKVNLYQRYGTCAVVGNSGEVLNSTRGSFIDEHDAVIRVNNARAKPVVSAGFPISLHHYIGSKTTIMFMNSHILHECSRTRNCQCHPYGLQVPIILYLCDVEHMLDVSICGSEHKAPLFVTDRRLDLLVTKIARWYSLRSFFNSWGGSRATKWRQWELLHDWEAKHKHEFHYSTGMEAVVFALGICKHVDLFGFGKNPNFKHHFHSLQRIEHYGHDFDAEYSFYDDLEKGRVNANPFLCGAGTYIPPLRVFH